MDDLNDGLVNRHEFGAIWKSGFNLDVWNHIGHTIHHITGTQYTSGLIHELSHSLALSGALHDKCADECNGFRVIQFEAFGPSSLSQQRGCEDEQFIFFARREFHGFRK